MSAIYLGVNIDHVATLRQARGTRYPDPVAAAMMAEEAGADGITLHLREDRRHIQERDVLLLKSCIQTRMNLEIAVTPVMIDFALQVMPEHICLVPEKRQEITTEGGLDVAGDLKKITEATKRLQDAGIEVSLFIDPNIQQIDAAIASGAKAIEIHTGCYADATTPESLAKEFDRIATSIQHAAKSSLIINAGHGLHYHNVQAIAAIPHIYELNIGHAIVARAVMTGFKEAVATMKTLMSEARRG